MQCAHCGSNVPDGAATCPICGTAVAPASTDSPFRRPGDMGADGFTLSKESVSPVYKPHVRVRCTACGAPISEKDKFCTKCGAPSPLRSDDAAKRLAGSGIHVKLGSGHAAAPRAAAAAPASAPPRAAAAAPASAPPRAAAAAPASAPPSAAAAAPASASPSAAAAAPASASPRATSKPPASFANIFMRRLCGSPLFVVVTIFCTLCALLSAVNTCKAILPFFEHVNSFDSAVIVILPLCNAVVLLCWVIGAWLLFIAAKSSSHRPFSTGGLTTIKIAFIASLFLLGLSVGYYASRLILKKQFAGFKDLYINDRIWTICFLAGLGVVLILEIIFHLKVLLTASATARTVRYNAAPPKPSAFMGVFLMLCGAVNLLVPHSAGLFTLVRSGRGYDFLNPDIFLDLRGDNCFDFLKSKLFAQFRTGHYFDYLGSVLKDMPILPLLTWIFLSVSCFLLGILVFFARKKWKACLSH